MKRHNQNIFVIILILATLLMSIGYASVNNIIMDIAGLVTYQEQSGIYISNIKFINSSYTAENNNSVVADAQTMINSKINLSSTNKSSYVVYEITVYNSTNYTYAFNDSLFSIDEFFYDNEDIIFEVSGVSKYDRLNAGDFKTFRVTFKYRSNLVNISNNTLNAIIKFDFRRLYTITYNDIDINSYREVALEGESFDINFVNQVPANVDVTGVESYSYVTPVLSLVNVQNNIVISMADNFELALYTFNGTTDYIDTGMRVFSAENINRDFEISFTIVDFSNNIPFATLINAMDESGSPWPGFTFRYEERNGQLSMFTVANANGQSNSVFMGTSIKKVKVQRINNVLYYQYDDGDVEEFFDFTGMRVTFDAPLTIGASIDGNGNPFRYFRGTLSNMSFRYLD